MTVEQGQPALPVDPQASLRNELVGQLAAAQLALEAAIAELSRNGGDAATIAASRIQLSSLISLRQQIGTATGSALAELRAEVFAAASSATALAQQATGSASNSNAVDATTRAAAARQTIENVGRQIFGDKVLDPYLQFTSKEDEEAYRKRERERDEAYNRALALGTPEGDRRALEIQKQQIADAKAHGADRAPELPAIETQIAQATVDLQPPAPRVAHDEGKGAKPGTADPLDDIMATLQAAGVGATHPKIAEGDHGWKRSGGKSADSQAVRNT